MSEEEHQSCIMEISKHFPLLVAQDVHGHRYSGFLQILGNNFHVSFHTPHGCNDLTDLEMECDCQMMAMLNEKRHLVHQRLRKSSTLLEFIIELKVIMESELKSTNFYNDVKLTDFHAKLMDQINNVGWDNVAYVSDSLREIHLKAVDQNARVHQIEINLTDRFPEVAPSCRTTIPEAEQFIFDTAKPDLNSIYSQFIQRISIYQDFWSVMDELDRDTWVLEPENPTREDTRRRMSVAPSASILLTIDPKQPRSLPEFKFLGPEKIIAPLKERLMASDTTQTWNTNDSIVNNIQNLLGIELPSPLNTKEEEYRVDCGICYTHLLDGAVPDVACDYTNCGQLYHQVCLYEWLRSLPNSRQSFNIIFGECPYCTKPVSAKITSKQL